MKKILNLKSSGKTDVQILNITKKINNLKIHLLKNKKDKSSQNGLKINISKRKKLLIYLKKKEDTIYYNLIKKLDLRR